jgi:hypothetical protein
MAAPHSKSEKKASSHAELSLRGLRSRVQRADLRQAALYTEWLEPCQRPETLAEVSPAWPILPSVPAQACAHAYEQRTSCFRAWPCTAAIVPSFLLRTQESAFNGMAWESAAAKVRATQGCDPRPIRLTRLLGLLFWRGFSDVHGFRAACSRRGVNPPLLSPRGLCAVRVLLLFRCASPM